jgi:acyl carrier protein
MDRLRSEIREFIAKNFYLPDPTALCNEASLMELGIVDSTGVLEVIGFLEDTYDIRVDDEETVPDNLDSVEHLASFVKRKRTVLATGLQASGAPSPSAAH